MRRLLLQARRWFSPHPERSDAVSVAADPAEVRQWMADTDHALLDEAPQAGVNSGVNGGPPDAENAPLCR